MNILVTGCYGQLGNEIQALEASMPNHKFFNTDRDELDITNFEAVDGFVTENKIDGIINCAAYTAVDKAEGDIEMATLLNATSPGYLARAIERRGGFLVQVSTDYVFDGTHHKPYMPEDDTCPDSVYGRTKLEGERNAMSQCKRVMVIRTAWLYSIHGNNFVKTMLRLGKEKTELGVIYDQIGTPTYAGDLASVIMTAVNDGIVPGIYHFTDEGVTSWYDFTKAIHRMAGIKTCHVKPLRTEQYPTPAHRPHYSVLDKTKIKETYHVEIPHWEESLEKCVAQLTHNS